MVLLTDIPIIRTDLKTSQEAVTSALEQYGHLDGIVLNAGVLEPTGTVDSIPVDAWKSHFDVNFFSLLHTLQCALPALRKVDAKGKIIMVSSGAAIKGSVHWGPYSASKAAMNSLAR